MGHDMISYAYAVIVAGGGAFGYFKAGESWHQYNWRGCGIPMVFLGI